MGEDRLTNPKYYEFRKAWHKVGAGSRCRHRGCHPPTTCPPPLFPSQLYYHFKPGRWYWELVICARKALLAFVSLMFRASPSYQLALALLVLFGCYVLHMRALPYLTHADKPKVIAEHQAKVLTDPTHATIEAEMRAAERKFAKKSSVRAAVFDVTKRKFNAGQAILLAVFDYNTVEAVMLASAILVQLAGIVFDSSHFADINMTADRRLQVRSAGARGGGGAVLQTSDRDQLESHAVPLVPARSTTCGRGRRWSSSPSPWGTTC